MRPTTARRIVKAAIKSYSSTHSPHKLYEPTCLRALKSIQKKLEGCEAQSSVLLYTPWEVSFHSGVWYYEAFAPNVELPSVFISGLILSVEHCTLQSYNIEPATEARLTALALLYDVERVYGESDESLRARLLNEVTPCKTPEGRG